MRPDDDLDDEDDDDEDDDGFYPPHCLKVVLRSGHEALLNIDPPKDAKRIWRVLMDDDRSIDHLEFSTRQNHVWIRLEHVLFAELIDDPAADEKPVLDGALVRYCTGHERLVDLPEHDFDDEWGTTPSEALGLALSFTTYAKSVAYEAEDGTTVHLNTEAAEFILWARDEAMPDFDAEAWAELAETRKKLAADAEATVDELPKRRSPSTKGKPMRRRLMLPPRWR